MGDGAAAPGPAAMSGREEAKEGPRPSSWFAQFAAQASHFNLE